MSNAILEQGCMSTVKVIGDRIFKVINKRNIEGTIIPLYEEYKILKYVQKLGPEFPQNVKCEGPLSLSYDYVKGITLKSYLQNNELTVNMQKSLTLQYLLIHEKLISKGFYHQDPNYGNFIVDNDNKLHIIDFGMTKTYRQDMIGINQRNLPEGANFDDYPEPEADYIDVKFYDSGSAILEEIRYLINIVTRTSVV